MTKDSHFLKKEILSRLRYPIIPQAYSLLLFTIFDLYCLSHIIDIFSL
jgi:hypothetical protein